MAEHLLRHKEPFGGMINWRTSTPHQENEMRTIASISFLHGLHVLGLGLAIGSAALLSGPEAAAQNACGPTVQVSRGDTFFSIAERCGTTVAALQQANPDVDAHDLQIGMTLQMAASPDPEGEPQAQSGEQPAQDGQTAVAGSRMVARGVLTDDGVECQAMLGEDGQIYTLIGDLDDYQSGDTVEVRGTVPEVSFCEQGTTIDIDEIRSAG